MNILTWFKEEQQKSTLQQKIIPLTESKEWHITSQGKLEKKDGKYYEVVIVAYQKPGEPWYENAMIHSTSPHQFQERQAHGVVLLAQYKDKFLVQAKAEAGNSTPGHIVLTTTIQSNHENVNKYPIPYKDLITKPALFRFAAPQDAGMFYGKHNEYLFVQLQTQTPTQDHFFWATLEEIKELQKLNLVGDHLTQMLGHIMISGVMEIKNGVKSSKIKKIGVQE
ncbi:NDP-hexose 2,3-dehydratase family protein [Candidatus Woesearchaeota archaeon]|nr:NDP-hexose 2,3-dehydratase family protein [Candidatus Woesearchaeota archaeon]